MQVSASFHNLRHGTERAEAQTNSFRTPLAVKESALIRGLSGARSPVDRL